MPPEIAERLGPDERVLWWGRAAEGGIRDSRDLPEAILAGGAGLALVAVGVGRVVAGATGVTTTVALVLFGLFTIGITVASLSIGERHRRGSIYAITDQRLLFLLWQRRGGPRSHALPLTEPVYPSVRVNASGSGTISFKPDDVSWRREIRRIERWTFEGIADVRSVLAIYQRALDDLPRHPPPR
jgi:hypothetical protein